MRLKPRFDYRPRPRRPALVSGLAAAAGITVAAEWPEITPAIIVLAGVSLALALGWRRPGWKSGCVGFTLLGLVGAGRYVASVAFVPSTDLDPDRFAQGEVRIFGSVVSEPEPRQQRLRFVFRVDSVAAVPAALRRTGCLQVVVDSSAHARYGDYLALDGRLSAARGARNPGEFDYARYLERRDILGRFFARAGDVHLVPRDPPFFDLKARVIVPLRARIYAALMAHMPPHEANLLLGLLFGERRGLSPVIESQFQNTGTLHLLAVSGGNVAVVIAVVWGALGFVRLSPAWRRPLILIGIVVFAQLSYNEPSVLRASVAAGLATIGHARHRAVDPLNTWGAALLLLLLWDPRQLFAVGFQLSFLATLGILVGMPLLGGLARGRSLIRRLARPLALALGVSLAAQVAVIPIMAAAFNQVPLITPISNLLCVPLAGLATAAGLVTLLLAPLGDTLHALGAAAAWASVRALLEAVAFFDALHFPQWYPSTPTVAAVATYYAVLWAAWLFAVSVRWRRLVLFGLLGFAVVGVGYGSLCGVDRLRMVHFDLGAGSCSALLWPDGNVWLVVGGEQPPDAVWPTVVTPFLRRAGWSAPALVAALEPEFDLSGLALEWPEAHLVGGRGPGAAGSGAWPATPDPFRVTARVGSGAGLWALECDAPGWSFVWYRSHYGIDLAPPPDGIACWAAIPALPWDYEKYLAAHPALHLLECAHKVAPPSGAPEYARGRVLSVLTSGAVVTSATAATLSTEPSIR